MPAGLKVSFPVTAEACEDKAQDCSVELDQGLQTGRCLSTSVVSEFILSCQLEEPSEVERQWVRGEQFRVSRLCATCEGGSDLSCDVDLFYCEGVTVVFTERAAQFGQVMSLKLNHKSTHGNTWHNLWARNDMLSLMLVSWEIVENRCWQSL